MSKAEQALSEAHAKSENLKVSEIADLEDDENSLSQSSQKEKGVGVTAWMRFSWEAYRIVLEILKNIPKLEELYAHTAQQAFGFCHTFSRANEFRRLSEILRGHLQALQKAANNPNQNQNNQAMSLSNPETVQLLLEIRFAQLNVATKMGLWQESFRSVEDVHGLIVLSKRTPPPERMALYYEKLTQIFWKAKNYLFHAYSCIKYFKALQKCKAEMSEEQKGALGSQVLLAALSIPVTEESESEVDFDFDTQKEKNYRLATLLGLSAPLPRGALIADLISKGVLELAYPELVEFYKLTESKFSPLTFNAAVIKHLEFIRGRGELSVYADSIAANCFRRLMQRLTPYFQTVKLARLATLASFITPVEIEKLIIESVSNGLLSVRIDHRVGVVRFSSDRLDSDDMKSCLSSMSSRLETTVQNFEGVKKQQIARKQKVFAAAMEAADDEHTSILIRKAFIEKRKEAEEEKNRRRKAEEEQKKVEEALERKKKEEEAAEALQKKQQEVKEKIQKARAELIQKEVEEAKGQESVKAQVEKLKEEKETQEKRLKSLTKKLDHLERARRQEERPLLEELFQSQLKKDEEYHREQFQKSLEDRQNKHKQQIKEKTRVLEILPHREKFEASVSEGRQVTFEDVLTKEKERRAELQKKLDEFLEVQKGLFSKKDGLEEQRKKIDDELRRKREEEEEKKRKEREEREKAAREKQAALDRQSELQRKREQEIRERQAQRQNSSGGDSWKSRRDQQAERSDAGEGKWASRGSRSDEGKWKRNERSEGGWAARRDANSERPERSEGSWKARRDQQASESAAPAASSGGGWRDRQSSRDNARPAREEPPARSSGGGGGWRDRQASRDSDRPQREGGSSGTWKSRRQEEEWTTVGSKKNDRWGAKREEGSGGSGNRRW